MAESEKAFSMRGYRAGENQTIQGLAGRDLRAKRTLFLIAKRSFDILASALALAALSPFLLLIAGAVKLASRGSVLYAHERLGKDGLPFRMFKFRSMYQNAAELFEAFTPEMKEEFYKNYKLDHDPRVTKIGKFLRKTSLDELPQLINVLKGEMSLVGPRPIVAAELPRYGERARWFLSMRPGLTGYWQAHGRSNTTYEERVELELYYIGHASVGLDLHIIWKTVWMVLAGHGAK